MASLFASVSRRSAARPVRPAVARRRLACALVLAMGAAPALLPAVALARGGGFGGGGFGGGGGGFHFGGAGYDGHSSADGWSRGYQGYHPAYGPNARPAWQGGGTVNRTTVNKDFDNDSF